MIRPHHYVIAGLDPAIQSGTHGVCCPWMPGSFRLVLGPAEPDPSAGHDDASLMLGVQP